MAGKRIQSTNALNIYNKLERISKDKKISISKANALVLERADQLGLLEIRTNIKKRLENVNNRIKN